jgi:hypothetical protein
MQRAVIFAFYSVCFATCGGSAPERVTSKAPESVTGQAPGRKPSDEAERVTSNRLLELARMAKSRGESSITTRVILEGDTKSTLDMVLRSKSVLLATHLSSGRGTIVGDAIRTPHEFRVDRWMGLGPASPESCVQVSVPGTSSQGSVHAATWAGRVTVEGIEIIEGTESLITFNPRQQYLLFVNKCPDNRIELSHGLNSIFIVSSDGKVAPAPYNEPLAPFVSEVALLGNLSAIEIRISSLARQ